VVGVLLWDQSDYREPHLYNLVLKQLCWVIVFGSSVGS
jgi:hypothetical protein